IFNYYSLFILCFFCYILVFFFPDFLELQMYAYTMYGAAITPVVSAAFFWDRATPAGAISTIIVGGGITLLWEQVLNRPLDWNASIVSVPIAILTRIIVSLLTKKKPEEQIKLPNE